MGVAARTVVKIILKTPVTTAGGAGTALARSSRTPASAAPVADLLRYPGGKRRVIVPVLADIPLAETADVVVTGVEKRKPKIALQNPHLHPEHPRPNNFPFPNSANSTNSASLILTCPCKNLPTSSYISMRSKRQRGGGTAWIGQGAPGSLRRALGAKAPGETSGTIVTGSSAVTAGGTPESVTPATDLLRDPGGRRRMVVPF